LTMIPVEYSFLKGSSPFFACSLSSGI
jgi:hypothetical protein